MNKSLPKKPRTLKGSLILLICAIASIGLQLIGGINNFLTYKYTGHDLDFKLALSAPKFASIITGFFAIAAAVLLFLYVMSFYKSKIGKIIAPVILAPLLINVLFDIIAAISRLVSYNWRSVEYLDDFYGIMDFLLMLVRPFAVISLAIGLLVLIFSALRGFHGVLFNIIGAVFVLAYIGFSVINYGVNVYGYINYGFYAYIFTGLLTLLGVIAFYVGFILLALFNNVPGVIRVKSKKKAAKAPAKAVPAAPAAPAAPKKAPAARPNPVVINEPAPAPQPAPQPAVQEEAPAEGPKPKQKITPEQALKVLKYQFENGMITEEEYRERRAYVIKKIKEIEARRAANNN